MAHILVVDDDSDILKIVQKLLESVGHVTVCCLDPHDALDKWNREIFDLVLSDANMPHINGFDFVKTVSQNARGLGTAVALLTGRRDRKDVERGLQAGADDYLLKPIDPDIFLSKVENLLNIKASHRIEIRFTEAHTRVKADWKVETEITQISEQGLTLFSPILGVKNSKINIACDLFNTIGIPVPILRVLDSTPDPAGSCKFFTKVSFVGMNDGDLQKIRYWINMNLAQVKKPDAA